MVNNAIFKAYDVRGIYPDPLNEESVEAVGRAFVAELGAKQVVVGRDMRLSSPALFNALDKGITEAGADVIDIGIVPTPVLSFAVVVGNHQAGVMISASHNPPEYNGLKLIGPKGVQLSKGTGIEAIAKRVTEGNISDDSETGQIIEQDIRQQYYDHILTLAEGIKPGLKVVIDAGNGMGGEFNQPVLDQLPIEYQPLYFEPDGTYPNHPANPAEDKNLEPLISRVKETNADLGIAFDGDADRAIFVDDQGRKFNPGWYLVLVGQAEVAKSQDKRVYYDLRFPKVVKSELEKIGAQPILTRVGNPFYKQRLIEDGGAMAVELSGHVMFADGYGLDDGLLAVVKLLKFLSNSGQRLSELVRELESKSFYPGEMNIESHQPAKIIDGLKEHYAGVAEAKISDMDGLSVEFGDWWFNVRASNTEPVIRLTMETKPDKVYGEAKQAEIFNLIKSLENSPEEQR